MLRMQELAFPGFKFQTFSGGVRPQTQLFLRGMSATWPLGIAIPL
jgi:hypothetical protein